MRFGRDDAESMTKSFAGAVALLCACRSARDRLLVFVLCRSGLRRSEAMGLRRADIHFLPDSLG
jgi:integrase